MRLSEMLTSITKLIWEEFCIFCETPGQFVCEDCKSSLPLVRETFCTVCGRPFPYVGVYATPIPPHPCARCLKEPPAYDKHRALLSYEGVARDLVHNLKYKGDFWIRQFYKSSLSRLAGEFEGAELIVPIPLHRERLKSRGFNQSLLLAQAWQEVLRKPVVANALIRVDNTASQTGLTRVERERNLKNAFEPGDAKLVKERRVLLVDDVHTTGTTLNEASRVLKKAGATEVLATTLAVVPMESEEK